MAISNCYKISLSLLTFCTYHGSSTNSWQTAASLWATLWESIAPAEFSGLVPFVPNLQSCCCSFWGLYSINSFPYLGLCYWCLLNLDVSRSSLSSFSLKGSASFHFTTPPAKSSHVLHHSSFIALVTTSACLVGLFVDLPIRFPLLFYIQ